MTASSAAIQSNRPDNETLSVRIAEGGDKYRWDDFVGNCTGSTFFHRFAWSEVIQETYGHQPYFLIAENQAGQIRGVLPLVLVKSPFFGRSMISTAFTIGGGILATSDTAHEMLAKRAIQLAETENVEYLELRGGEPLPDWHVKNETYAHFEIDLITDEETAFRAVPKKRRVGLRKAKKAIEDHKLRCSTSRNIDTFYDLYAKSVHNLGTPVPPRKWFRTLFSAFENDIEIFVAESDDGPVSSLLSFYHDDCVLPYYIGGIDAARKLHANDFLYWAQMRKGVERGFSKYDFGRSKFGTGTFAYKEFWGGKPAPLTYQYHLVKAKSVPDINPNNRKFNFMTKVWRRLPPAAANYLGPKLAGSLA